MTELLNKTISQIVTEHHQTAAVFERLGIDFCCKGKRPLAEAVAEKELNEQALLEELQTAIATEQGNKDYQNMSLTELAEYIVRVHHTYVRNSMPHILSYVLKVASKHGDRFPYMKEVFVLFSELNEEMMQHMFKEEKVLFPRIKLLEIDENAYTSMDYYQQPIDMMEDEHERAGEIMFEIRELTNNYEAPESACTTFRLALSSLQAFEADLHQHVHLENNILFPKAIELVRSIQNVRAS